MKLEDFAVNGHLPFPVTVEEYDSVDCQWYPSANGQTVHWLRAVAQEADCPVRFRSKLSGLTLR